MIYDSLHCFCSSDFMSRSGFLGVLASVITPIVLGKRLSVLPSEMLSDFCWLMASKWPLNKVYSFALSIIIT
jgi:hypothetical protein